MTPLFQSPFWQQLLQQKMWRSWIFLALYNYAQPCYRSRSSAANHALIKFKFWRSPTLSRHLITWSHIMAPCALYELDVSQVQYFLSRKFTINDISIHHCYPLGIPQRAVWEFLKLSSNFLPSPPTRPNVDIHFFSFIIPFKHHLACHEYLLNRIG